MYIEKINKGIILVNLIPPKVVGLQETQKNFDNYQMKAFPARTSQFFALEICGEAGELANLEKKIWRDASKENELQAQIGAEAADVFIALTNYANSKNINLEEEVNKKLLIIEDRRINKKMGEIKT